MRAKTYVSKKPCPRGHFIRYMYGRCVECACECRRAYYRTHIATEPVKTVEQRLVALLTDQLNAQKARWGFI